MGYGCNMGLDRGLHEHFFNAMREDVQIVNSESDNLYERNVRGFGQGNTRRNVNLLV